MRVSTFASVIGLALVTAVAQAQVSIWEGPGNFQDDENVLFNDPTLLQSGTHVQGHTNQNHFVVDFFSTSSLKADGGQAKIESDVKGGSFTDLSLSMNDPSLGIGTLIFSLDAMDTGSITFNIAHSGGMFTQTFDIDKNGQNWFRIAADSDVSISSVSFLTDVGVKDVKHVRLGAVPEPATLIGLGLGAVALMRRRRKSVK